MARRSKLEVALSDEERRELEAWQRSTTMRAGLAKRGRVVLLRAANMPLSHIAARVGMRRRHVQKWIQRFRVGRIDALSDRKGRGRKPSFPPGSGRVCREDRLRAA